jgi:hypothetical protein
VSLTAHLAIECKMGNYGTVRDGALALKGSHSMGDGRIFLKSLSDASFNEDLWNEPNLDWIHLAGQYL